MFDSRSWPLIRNRPHLLLERRCKLGARSTATGCGSFVTNPQIYLALGVRSGLQWGVVNAHTEIIILIWWNVILTIAVFFLFLFGTELFKSTDK